MFFGKVISKNSPFAFSEENVDASAGEVLSITNLTLAPGSGNNASLWVKKENEDFFIGSVAKDHMHLTVNLFVSLIDNVTFHVKGDGTIHITGFFEPEQGDLPLDADFEGEDD